MIIDELVYSSGWQSSFLWCVYAGFVLAFFLAFGMGANDCANSYGCVYGSKVLKLWQIYGLATVFETLGAALLGYRVTETMRKSIVEVGIYNVYSMRANGTYSQIESCPANTSLLESRNDTCSVYTSGEFIVGELGALGSTAFWLIFATVFKMPVSTTHSSVGGTVGFSLVMRGASGIHWVMIKNIVLSWLISPLLAGFVGSVFYMIIKVTVLMRKDPFESALRVLPFCFWFAIFVNMFAVFFHGSKYLHFENINGWQAFLLSFGAGGSVAGFLWFWGIKRIRHRANVMHEKEILDQFEESKKIPKDNVSLKKGLLKYRMKVILNHNTETNNSPCETGTVSPFSNGFPPLRNDTSPVLTVPQTPNSSSVNFNGIHDSLSGNVTPSFDNFDSGSPAIFTTDSGSSTAYLFRTPISGIDVAKVPKSAVAVDPKSLKTRLSALVIPAEEDPKTVKVFHFLQILSACFLSFSHGSNDTANAVGPLVGLWLTYKYGSAAVSAENDITLELIIIFGALSMIIGLWCLGHKVIKTIGNQITKVTAPSGFCMELATAFTVILGSRLGIPLSTTHCMVGAVVIVGFVKTPKNGVQWKTFAGIVVAWITTLPVTMGVSGLITYLLAHFYLGSM